MSKIHSAYREGGERSRLTLPYRRPSYAKRFSDLTSTTEDSRRSRGSLNARYDKERARTPPLRRGLGVAAGRNGAHRIRQEEVRVMHDSLPPDQEQWLDDLLSGRIPPKNSQSTISQHLARGYSSSKPDSYFSPHTPLERPLYEEELHSTAIPQDRVHPELNEIQHLQAQSPSSTFFLPEPYPLHFIPDQTPTPTSQTPGVGPSLVPFYPLHYDPYRTPTPPALETTGFFQSQKFISPPLTSSIIRGILKNNYLKPFYPSSQAQRVSSSSTTNNRVRFNSALQERVMSPAWSSTPSMASTEVSDKRRIKSDPFPGVPGPDMIIRSHPRSHIPGPGGDQAGRVQDNQSMQALYSKTPVTSPQIPTSLVQVHQAIISSRDSYTPVPKVDKPASRRKTVKPVMTHIPVLQAFEASLQESPLLVLKDGRHEDHSSTYEANRSPGRNMTSALKCPADPGSDYGDTLIGTDELNLRSMDDIEMGKADYIDHCNYPQQVHYDHGDSNFELEYYPHSSEHSPDLAPAMRLSEAAWTFDIPKDVERRARLSANRTRKPQPPRKNANTGVFSLTRATETTRHVTSLKSPRRYDHPVHADGVESPEAAIDGIDETLESISVFSDDEKYDEKSEEDIQDIPERRLSPVAEEGEEDEEDEEDDEYRARERQKEVDEGFFADGGQVGFKVWKDGY